MHLAARQREDRRPGRPGRGRRVGARADLGPEALAGERGGVVDRPGPQGEVRAAGRRAQDALVVGQLDEDPAQLRLVAGSQCDTSASRAPLTASWARSSMSLSNQARVVRRDDDRGAPGQEGQAGHERDREPQGLPHRRILPANSFDHKGSCLRSAARRGLGGLTVAPPEA